MNFLMGLLPLLVFVLVDSFSNLKTALITAIIFAVIEVIFSLYSFGEIDVVTWFSFILVFIMAVLSIKKDNDIYFKMQPVILSLGMAIFFIVTYYMGHPILAEMIVKYRPQLPIDMQERLNHPMIVPLHEKATLTIGIGLIGHAALTTYAALKMSKWWWIAMRGIGFYGFMFLGYFWALQLIS